MSPLFRIAIASAVGGYFGHYAREKIVNAYIVKPDAAKPLTDNENALLNAACVGVTATAAWWALGKV